MSRTLIRSNDECQICNHSFSYEILTKTKEISGKFFQSTWVECANCGSAHIDPYPTEDNLLKYYSSGYIDMDFAGTTDHHSSHKLHYSDRYEDIVFENYGYSIQDAGYSIEDLKNLKILDYGCANGIFYKYLTHVCGLNHNNIYGIDIDSDMLEACQKMSQNFYSTKQLRDINEKFDLITLWNVIEHIYKPEPALKEIINLLQDNGEILIETPMYGLLANKLREEWSHYIVVEHINLFSRDALINMFDKFGMKCISASSFGANLFGEIQPRVKSALDQIAKKLDFGATQVLRFKKY